ncbi:MAG: adenylate/guanylate cyclase protein [Proteobacteria bacterium]|nr:adenylate/guanylate cyclase protein [Pseudomonadota bacterium]
MQPVNEHTHQGECVHVIAGVANTKALMEKLGEGETKLFLVRALKRAESAAKHLGGEIVTHATDHLVILAPNRESAALIVESVQAKLATLWVPRNAEVSYFARVDEHMTPRRSSRVHARISYGNEIFLLDSKAPLFTVGRLQSACLHIQSERVSRRHATLELQSDRIILSDSSTNGSFIRFEGETSSHRVHQRKLEIHSNAVISFGSLIDEPKSARITLEIVQQGRRQAS